MIFSLIFCLAVVFGCTSELVADPPFSLDEMERAAGFELLVIDATLTGWQHNGNWNIEDGVVTRKGGGGSLT